MRNNIISFTIITLILFFIFITKTSAQIELSNLQIETLISDLDSTNHYHKVKAAINRITKDTIYQALPKIEQTIWQQQRSVQNDFLIALYTLGSDKAYEFTHAFYDTLDVNPTGNFESGTDIPQAKVLANEILFKYDDYSKVNFIFEEIERQNETSLFLASFLPTIVKNVPEYSELAKQKLLESLESENSWMDKIYKIGFIEEALGSDAIPKMVEIFRTDTSSNTRRLVLQRYLSNYSNQLDLHSLVKERLNEDPDPELRLYLVKVLLNGYAYPEDYQFVQNFLKNESDEKNGKMVEYELKIFRPFYSSKLSDLTNFLNSLNSYLNQTYQISWLQNQQFKEELEANVAAAKTFLENDDSTNCYKEIAEFNDAVNTVYLDSAGSAPKYVSEEGWKFLYYYSNYILERLPKPSEELTNADVIALLNELKTSTEECLTNGWLSGSWVKDALFASLNSAISALEQDLPQSCKPIMVQFNSILESYLASAFLTQDAYDLLRPKSENILLKLDELITTPDSDAMTLLEDVIAAHETCNNNGWYSYDWVYTTFTSSLDNAVTQLEQNNKAGCLIVINGFVSTLESYKTSGYVTDEGYNLLMTKTDLLIEKLNE